MNETNDVKPSRESQLTTAINRLEKAVSAGLKIRLQLADRLENVLRPECPTPCTEKQPEAINPEPPAVSRISRLTESLEAMNGEYGHLTDRVEA